MATNNRAQITAEPGGKEMVVTRMFDAPRELVFKANTDPRLMAQWWGPRQYTITIDKMDVRPGGQWRIVHRDAEGNEYGLHGEFREIVPPERISLTFEFEGMPGKVSVETTTFEDEGGKTKLTTRSVYDSVEDRDGMLQSGMEDGMQDSYQRLDELLERETQKTPQ